MQLSWITLYPNWYAQEVDLLHRHFPEIRIDETKLNEGQLVLYGNLVVRPPGGPKLHPIQLKYQEGTPYEHPSVTPLESLPDWNENGGVIEPVSLKILDHRHQMPAGNLCLFQRETRSILGGEMLSGIDILKRAEDYFFGFHTGHWPPDTIDSELESHFTYVSDALIADIFYEELTETNGRFFFVPDLRRLRDVESNKVCPIIITSMTAERPIIRNFDARDELSRVYPWIKDQFWNSYDYLVSEASGSDTPTQPLQYGYWWSLPKEPHPFHNGEGLLRALALTTGDDVDRAWQMFNSSLGQDMTTDESHLIALRYPARRGGFEWLLLFVVRYPHRESGGLIITIDDACKRREFENSQVFMHKVHRLNREALAQRNTGVISSNIKQKTLALIGLGALGSKVAELLAQAGVGRFRLCDNDRLRIGNVARHVAGVTDFGALKVNAMISRLLDINPYLKFDKGDVVTQSVDNSLERLCEFIDPADLVVCTTADESIESVVNQIAVIKCKCVLYGRSLRRGSMGRVFLVRPRKDACKACLAHYGIEGRQSGQAPADWIDIPEEENEVLYHECARPVIASSAIDLSFTASLIARVALNFLEEKKLSHNHWVWSQYVSTDIDPRLDREMVTVPGSITPYEQCPACREPEVVKLVLSERVKSEIINITENSLNVETGGILIGYLGTNGQAVALRSTGPGPNAVCTQTEFHRDIKYVQSELDRAASDLGDRGVYIGEWHSHLVTETQPSPKDIKSLFEISKAPNYLTRCPVMVIAGVDISKSKETTLGTWAFPVSGRMYQIEIQIVSDEQIGI